MFKKAGILVSLSLSLILSGCTVDAQLASQLLSSLQKSVKNNTGADGKVNLTAKDLSSAAEAAGVKVVCGGADMSIASADDDEDEATDEEVLDEADTIHPVLIGYGPEGGASVRRIHIDIDLENELRDLPNVQGPEREQRFRQICERFPQMRNAAPMPVRGGQGREVVFGQFGGPGGPGGQPGQGGKYEQGNYGQSVKYGQAQYGQKPQANFRRPAPPPPPNGDFMPGEGPFMSHEGGFMSREDGFMPGEGEFMPGKGGFMPGPGKRMVRKAPIEGFTDAKGQPCELLSDDATEASEDPNQDEDQNED
ncbi:MAG TPA: hypothetical protein V6D23_10320 [Candidatus Obscuribacterales bacterium]